MSKLVSTLKQVAKATGVAKLVKNTEKQSSAPTVFVGMASIPSRVDSLRQVVEALLPQVTELGVYLNNWDAVPDFLRNPKIKVARSQDHGDVRDNGKFFWVEKTNARFYATVDDDINYPKDYIAQLIRYQTKLGGTYAVGVHGTTYPNPVVKLLRYRSLVHFMDPYNAFVPVDLLGTGTLLFERAYWNLKYSELGTPGMADVWFGVAAKKRDFGMWVIPRKGKWMTAIEQGEAAPANLFDEGRKDDHVQVQALKKADVGSSRRSLLERVVRVSRVGAEFSIADAAAIHTVANKIDLEHLDENDYRFFDYALVIHKREKIADLPEPLDEILEEYVAYLLNRASGNFYASDLEFEEKYKAVLRKVGFDNLPHFASQDWRFLGLKVPSEKPAKPSTTGPTSVSATAAKPSDVAKPVKSTKPAAVVKPVKAAKAAAVVKPDTPTKSATLAKPVKSTKSAAVSKTGKSAKNSDVVASKPVSKKTAPQTPRKK